MTVDFSEPYSILMYIFHIYQSHNEAYMFQAFKGQWTAVVSGFSIPSWSWKVLYKASHSPILPHTYTLMGGYRVHGLDQGQFNMWTLGADIQTTTAGHSALPTESQPLKRSHFWIPLNNSNCSGSNEQLFLESSAGTKWAMLWLAFWL